MPIIIGPPRAARPVWRYWAIVPWGAQNGEGWYLAEIAMASVSGGSNLCLGKTAVSLNVVADGALFDGNIATSTNSTANLADTSRAGVDFVTPVTIAEVKLTSQNGIFYVAAPTGFTLIYSSDGTTWRSHSLHVCATWTSAGQVQTFGVPIGGISTGLGRANARGWRINATADNGLGQVTVHELAFAATTGGSALTPAAFACSSGGSVPSVAPTSAFDGTTSTWWNPVATVSGRIGAIYTSPQNIAEVRLTAGATNITGAPRDFTVQFTEDGVSWTTALTPASQTGWVANVTRTFAVP